MCSQGEGPREQKRGLPLCVAEGGWAGPGTWTWWGGALPTSARAVPILPILFIELSYDIVLEERALLPKSHV